MNMELMVLATPLRSILKLLQHQLHADPLINNLGLTVATKKSKVIK